MIVAEETFNNLPSERRAGVIGEVVSARTLRSKTYDKGNGKFMVMAGGLLHYEDSGLKEIDLTPVDGGDHWIVDKASYIAKIFKSFPLRVEYTSKIDSKVATIELEQLDDVNVTPGSIVLTPTRATNRIRFSALRSDFNIEFEFKSKGIEWWKILDSAISPTAWTWIIEEDENIASQLATSIRGWDQGLKRAGQNNADLTFQVDVLPSRTGKVKRRVRESFEGRTSEVIDPVTRIRTWKASVDYPVIVDFDYSQSVADAEDGHESEGSWDGNDTNLYLGGTAATYDGWPAWRFTALNIPVGATIDNATFTIVKTGSGNWSDSTLFGNDTDQPAAWSGSNVPSNATATTASIALTNAGQYANSAHDVDPHVTEITGRGGWADGDDMAFFVKRTGTGYNANIAAGENASYNGALLTVDWTAAAAGGSPSLVMAPYIPAGR